MKNVNEQEISQVSGGLDLRQFEAQVAPEPLPDSGPIIDYNPEHPPQ